MQLEISEHPPHHIVTIFDERLDFRNSGEFKAQLNSILEIEDVKSVIFDLSQVTSLDSSALGVLIRMYQLLESHQATMKLVVPNKQPRAVFELITLPDVIGIYHSLEDAIE